MMRKIKWNRKVVTGLLFAIALSGLTGTKNVGMIVRAIGDTEGETMVTQDDEWQYEYVEGEDGGIEVTITEYVGDVKAPVLPAEIDGYPVTELGEEALKGNTDVTGVELPDSLVRIGFAAFYGCSSLEEIIIPDSVREVGRSAFYECSSLKSAVLSSSLKELNSSIFAKCTSLKSIWIPDGVETMDFSVFSGCTGLETAVIPPSVENMRYDVFNSCSNLTIYAEEESIGLAYADDDNHHVKGIPVNSALYPVQKSENGWLYTQYEDGQNLEIVGYQGDETKVEIPAQIDGFQTKWIAGRIFQETGLESLTFPDGVEKIGERVCEGCTGLKRMTLPETLCYLGDKAFWQCSGLTEVTIPGTVTYIGMEAFYQCENLSKVDFEKRSGSEELELGVYAFCECDLKSIELPEGLKDLRDYVFYNNESLEKAILPEGLEYIGNYCFSGCLALESVNLPSTVNYIWNAAFMGCQNITEITIPASVTTIENYAFDGCTSLKKATIWKNVTRINGQIFDGCEELTIYTSAGTEAERYAKEYDIPYVLLGDPSDGSEISGSPQPSDGAAGPVISGSPKPADGAADPAISESPKPSESAADPVVSESPLPSDGTADPAVSKNPQPSDGTESPAPSGSPQPSAGTGSPAPSKTPGQGTTQTPADTTVTTAPGQGTQNQPSTSGNQSFGENDTKKSGVSSLAAVKNIKAAAGRKVIAMNWKKVAKASGYQIQISKTKNFSGAKNIKVKKTKKNLNKLKRETVYYVRIRAYALNGSNGKTVYSKWVVLKRTTR